MDARAEGGGATAAGGGCCGGGAAAVPAAAVGMALGEGVVAVTGVWLGYGRSTGTF